MSEIKLDINDIPQKLKDASKSLKAMPSQSTQIKVKFNLKEGCFNEYCEQEFYSIHCEVGSSRDEMDNGTNLRFPVTLEEFKKYCTTFVASRIGYVNNEPEMRIIHPTDNVAIPAFLATALKMIGNVDDDANAIYYSMVIELGEATDSKAWLADNCLKKDRVIEIARYLRRIQTYHYGMNLPKDRTGRMDIMKLGILDGKVYTYDPSVHPALSLPVALLGQLYSVSDIYKARFYYGDLAMIGGKVCDLISIQW